MPLVLLCYKLTSEIMASKRTHRPLERVFHYNGGRIKTELSVWDWAMKEAARSLPFGKELDLAAVRPEISFSTPVISLYRRKFNDRRGDPAIEDFQCIPTGTTLEHRLLISSGPDTMAARHRKDLREPTPEDLQALFEYIGYFAGLSPWGNRLGYGRFSVQSVRYAEDTSVPDRIDDRRLRVDDIPGTAGDSAGAGLHGEDNGSADGDQTDEDQAIYRSGGRPLGADDPDGPGLPAED